MDCLDRTFGRRSVFGGLCRISVTVDQDGIIHHLDQNQSFVAGVRGDTGQDILRDLVGYDFPVGFELAISDNIDHAMWEKFYSLATLAAATCLMRAPIGCIASTGEGSAFMSELLSEAAAVAHAAEFTSTQAWYDSNFQAYTDTTSTVTASLLRDLEEGNPVEADHLVGDLYRRGTALGLKLPLLRLAWIHLQAAENRRNLIRSC